MTGTLLTLIYAFFGGLLPALLWLWFFNHEDPHPEPRGMLVKTFVAGMVAVLIAMFLEEGVRELLGGEITGQTLLGWAAIEEVVKFVAVWLVALRTRFMDEPIDAVIYMITAALGFAAMENMLFLAAPLSEAAYLSTALTGGMRFIGATLLHVAASGVLGALIGFAFYHTKRLQHEAMLAGLVGATLLHWGFNLLIMDAAQSAVLRTFGLVWMVIIILMLIFERVKRIKQPASYPFT